MSNKDNISWLISAKIRDGKLSEAKEHFQKMVHKLCGIVFYTLCMGLYKQ